MAERSTGPRQSDEEILASLDAAPDAIAVFYRRHAGGLLSHLERFLIPALVAVGALTYYAVPYEVLARVAIVPAAMERSIFVFMASAILLVLFWQ
jgi:hypothetical protein